MASKKIKTSFTNTKGQKVKVFTDGSKTFNGVSSTSTPSGALNAAQMGGASGVGFETPKTQAVISKVIKKSTSKGGSVASARDESERQRQIKEAIAKKQKQNRQKRQQRMKSGRLQSDNMRASNIDTTLGESVTAKGARSTRGISDKEVEDLAKRGFREGDFVPNRGTLLPDGTFDTSRLDKINEIKSKADLIVEQFNKFKERETLKTDDVTVSDTPIVQDEKKATDSIAGAFKENPMAESLALLDENILNIKEQLKGELQSINQSFGEAKTGLQGKQAGEMGTQSVQLANAGGYLGYSGSAQGVLLNLAESHRAELSALDVKRQQAIQEARNASANRQFDVVREKARIVEDIEKAAYQSQLDYQEKVALEAEKQAQVAEKQKVEQDIFTAIQGGAKTSQDIFNKLDGLVPAKTITDFLTNITKDIGDEGVFKFSASQNAMLLGSGMSMEDIKTFNEYVSENGYDEKVKSLLTPGQRKAADKILGLGSVGTGTGSGFTPQEKRKLEQAGLLEGSRQDQLDFLYGDKDSKKSEFKSVYVPQIIEGQTSLGSLPLEIQEDVRGELLDLGFGSDAVPTFYRDYIENEKQQSLSEQALTTSWSNYRKKALGEEDLPNEDGGWFSWFK